MTIVISITYIYLMLSQYNTFNLGERILNYLIVMYVCASFYLRPPAFGFRPEPEVQQPPAPAGGMFRTFADPEVSHINLQFNLRTEP